MVGMSYLIHDLYYIDDMSNNNQPQINVSDANEMLIENAPNIYST